MPTAQPALRDQLLCSLTLLAGVGLVAIGLSGLLAQIFGWIAGERFVSGDRFGVTYTPERCADYFEYFPDAKDCAAAATLHHFGEEVEYRVAAGLLGLLLLGGLALVRRRARHSAEPRVLPESFVPTVGATLFGFGALALLATSLANVAGRETAGLGAPLSGGLVSLVVFAAYARRLPRLWDGANGAGGEPSPTPS